jgi:hypothetical protein
MKGGGSMAPWGQVGPIDGFEGGASIGQVIAVVQDGEQRAFVSLDDLERWASLDAPKLPDVLRSLRTAYDSWEPKTGGIYVNEATVK